MSHITLGQQGLAALNDKKYEEALTKLSKALQGSANPAWLLGRSKALFSLKRYHESLDDAELAWHKAYERNKRDLFIEAQYRRAVAYHALGQHANADACCVWAMRLINGAPVGALEKETLFEDGDGVWMATAAQATTEAKEADGQSRQSMMGLPKTDKSPQATLRKMASMVRIQALSAMEKLPPDDDARRLSIGLKPEVKELKDVDGAAAKQQKDDERQQQQGTPSAVGKDVSLRIQEFQSNTTMSVSIFSKGVNKQKLQVVFSPFAVHLNPVICPDGTEKEFKLDLWAEIEPDRSSYAITPNKIELSLAKKVAGRWPTLKSEGKPATETKSRERPSTSEPTPAAASTITADPLEEEAEATAAATYYPTSSKTGPKNWDKIGADEGDEGEGDANAFFKQLYKNATPEQKRAMMKSFTESNGTSLSTDWNDVKDRTVKTVPPDGVEAKKW